MNDKNSLNNVPKRSSFKAVAYEAWAFLTGGRTSSFKSSKSSVTSQSREKENEIAPSDSLRPPAEVEELESVEDLTETIREAELVPVEVPVERLEPLSPMKRSPAKPRLLTDPGMIRRRMQENPLPPLIVSPSHRTSSPTNVVHTPSERVSATNKPSMEPSLEQVPEEDVLGSARVELPTQHILDFISSNDVILRALGMIPPEDVRERDLAEARAMVKSLRSRPPEQRRFRVAHRRKQYAEKLPFRRRRPTLLPLLAPPRRVNSLKRKELPEGRRYDPRKGLFSSFEAAAGRELRLEDYAARRRLREEERRRDEEDLKAREAEHAREGRWRDAAQLLQRRIDQYRREDFRAFIHAQHQLQLEVHPPLEGGAPGREGYQKPGRKVQPKKRRFHARDLPEYHSKPLRSFRRPSPRPPPPLPTDVDEWEDIEDGEGQVNKLLGAFLNCSLLDYDSIQRFTPDPVYLRGLDGGGGDGLGSQPDSKGSGTGTGRRLFPVSDWRQEEEEEEDGPRTPSPPPAAPSTHFSRPGRHYSPTPLS